MVAASDGATVCVTAKGDIYLLADYQCKKLALSWVWSMMRNSTSYCDSRRPWPDGGEVLGGREGEKRKEAGSLGEPQLLVP